MSHDEAPQLLAQQSARQLVLRQFKVTVGGGALGLALIAVVWLGRESLIGWFAFVIGLVAILAIGGMLMRGAAQADRAKDAEYAAGYTTLFGPPYEYWQLDDRTGEVLRRPGETKARPRSR
jgi:type IV secretory pathway VirB2 component (pilin)